VLWLLSSPHLIDLVLAFTCIEGFMLTAWFRRRHRSDPFQAAAITGTDEPNHDWLEPTSTRITTALRLSVYAEVGIMLFPGVCLMLAIRAAWVGAAWPWVPAALFGALIAHLFDLWVRWRD